MRRIVNMAVALSITLAITFATSASAQIPRLISYQGFLTDASGAPITGTRNFVFNLYTASSGGSAFWSELQSNVVVTNGIFEVALGATRVLDLIPFDTQYWLGTRVNNDPELTPRTRLAASPYSFRSIQSETVALTENFTVRTSNGSAPEAASSEELKDGLLVSIDAAHPGEFKVSGSAYDTRVAGVLKGATPAGRGSLVAEAAPNTRRDRAVAITGRVYCWVDASNASIQPGDLLTTSDVPGHAMKATHHARRSGAIIGKAMTGLEQGRGLILVLVSLQ